ncbi:Aldehyde/histidinol dehydrogenase [Xylariales sp. AK1849]|nr:Aldehyde/histidinol dehydrogenase [Xylariales sp. AK1849]
MSHPSTYINGKWINAKSSQTFEVTDPASDKVIGTMPGMGKEDTLEAIDAAASTLPAFRRLTARERTRMLRKWHELIKYAADYFEWFSEEAPRVYSEIVPTSVADHRVYTIKEPIGVCGLITPWNWPAGMTPLTAAALAELSIRAGIPPGVVNIVTSMSNSTEVGAALTSADIVKKVSFTGSIRVGKILMKQSANTLKKLSFELGGNAPLIIFDDADLESAVAGAVASKFGSAGQTCVCANRIYVKQFKSESGYADGVTHGPLIHAAAVGKVQQHIEDAVDKGGKSLAGGHKMPQLGANFFEPTVIRDMKSNMLLAHDETLALSLDFTLGLAGYLYSKDIQRCYRVAEALQVGMVGINNGMVSDVAVPFGSVKESGFEERAASTALTNTGHQVSHNWWYQQALGGLLTTIP